MSIVVPSERGSWSVARGPCFLCMEEIAPDVVSVMWAGAATVEVTEGDYQRHAVDIGLHIDCAGRLGGHLIGDAREAHLAQGDGVWGGRAERLKKAKLEREEWER
jgi:hypothetical protein